MNKLNKLYLQKYVALWHPKRKDIYPTLREMVMRFYNVELTEEQLQKIVRAHRTLQELIPNDTKGARLEREWRDERGMKSMSEILEDAKPNASPQSRGWS